MADAIGKLAVITSVENAALKSGFEDAVRMANRFYKALDGKTGSPTAAEGNIKRITAGLRDADAHAKSFGTSMRQAIVGGMVSGGTAAVAMIGGELLSAVGGGLGDIVKDSIQIANSIEVTSNAFETLAGGIEKSRDLMKELRQFARESPLTYLQSTKVASNLLGNGIRSDQVTPTLRMLSDAARGDPVLIDRLALVYGQIRSKGTLHGQDLNQINETGLPIIKALSEVLNKPVDNIKTMVENGQIGFDDVQDALKKPTNEGGAFFGMTSKYANSTAGSFDALRDSVEMLKGEFGKAIVEETGLKDMAKDAGAFADRMKDVVNEGRPVIRFAGDVVKAGAQLGYLGARMTAVLGNQAVIALMDRFPVIRETVDIVRKALHDIESLRFDDAKVQEFGGALFGKLSDALASAFEDPKVKKFYEDFKKEVTDPLKEAWTEFKSAVKTYKDAKELGNDVGDAFTKKQKALDAFAMGLTTQDERVNAMNEAHKKGLLPDTPEEEKRAIAFGTPRPLEPWQLKPGLLKPPPVEIVKADPWSDALHGMLGVSGGLLKNEAERKLGLRSVLGGFASMEYLKPAKAGGGPDTERSPNAQLRDKYKPSADKFLEEMDFLRTQLEKGKIDDRIYNLAVSDSLKAAGSHLGGEHLPSAQEFGSAELAKSLAQATAGVRSATVEQLLTQMRDYAAQTLEEAKLQNRAAGVPAPPVVKLPAQ